MKAHLTYFEKWREYSISLKKNYDEEWEKTFMSQQTYNNLILQVAGFFHCARYVSEIDTNEDIKFIPFLNSNYSSLESHFSEIRAQGDDTPKKYIVGIENIEYRKAAVSLSIHNNSTHSMQ